MINAIKLYKLSSYLYEKKFFFLSKKVDTINKLFCRCVVLGQTKIGTNTTLGYGGIGVVIHKSAIIGENCTISQNVTVGRKKGKNDGVPRLGDNVYVGANSVLMGDITIGHNCIIGPCTLVNKSIPPNSIVVGNPGKIVGKITEANYADYSSYNINYEKL